MTGTGTGFVMRDNRLLLPKWGYLFLFAVFFLMAGCKTMEGQVKKSEPDETSKGQVVNQEASEQITRLQSSQKNLQRQIRSLKSQLKAGKVAQESLANRLEVCQAAREEAVREVVRMRARIQGMASQAGASAMFAEARVILDRMEEEAFNAQALEDLDLARSYMARGKGALDTGNPGGAAYLFDLIPGLYEGMKKGDPRKVKVSVSVAALRKTPKSTAQKLDSLYAGELATGLEKNKDWMKVKTSSGQTGWIMSGQVQ